MYYVYIVKLDLKKKIYLLNIRLNVMKIKSLKGMDVNIIR